MTTGYARYAVLGALVSILVAVALPGVAAAASQLTRETKSSTAHTRTPKTVAKGVRSASVKPAPTTAEGYAAMFAALDPREWGGGDVSLSVALEDGRRVWVFADTLSEGHGLVNSTAIVQTGGSLHVSHAGAQLLPADEKSGPSGKRVFWPERVESLGGGLLKITATPVRQGREALDLVPQRVNGQRVAREALARVDARGDVTFVRWTRWVPPTDVPLGDDFTFGFHYDQFLYQYLVHDIELANGERLMTVSQNWGDDLDAHRNAAGRLRYSDWRPLYLSTDASPGWLVRSWPHAWDAWTTAAQVFGQDSAVVAGSRAA